MNKDTAESMKYLNKMGIINDIEEINIQELLTREQLSLLLVRIMGLEDNVKDYNGESLFSDVDDDSEFKKYINLIASEKIITPYNLFKPKENVPLIGLEILMAKYLDMEFKNYLIKLSDKFPQVLNDALKHPTVEDTLNVIAFTLKLG